MRKVIPLSKYLLLAGFLFVYSCKKSNEAEVAALPENETAAKVLAWLESQKVATQPNKAATIQLLKENLDFLNARTEASGQGEQILVIPVKEAFTSAKKIDPGKVASFVAILDKAGAIRKGNLVLFTPDQGQAAKIPDGTFYHIFNTATPKCNGQFKFLSPSGWLQYQLSYKDGKLLSAGIVQPKAKEGARTNMTCTDWYLVTTYHYADGTSETTEEYLYTTCDGCDDPLIESICPDEGAGGGGNGISYEYAVTTPVGWTPYTSPDNANVVYSEEYLGGTRAPNNGSKFSGITHNTDKVDNYVGVMDSKYATWHRDSWNATLSSDKKTGTTTISGRLTYPFSSNGNPVEVQNKTRTWVAQNDL